MDTLTTQPHPESLASLTPEQLIMEHTTAIHALIVIKQDGSGFSLYYANPAFKKLIKPDDEGHLRLPEYFSANLQHLLARATRERPVSSVTSIYDPELADSPSTAMLGITVEMLSEEGIFHLAGRDITDKQELKEQKHREATHDPMTGFLNREGYLELVRNINQEQRENQKAARCSIIYIDLSGVNTINNTLGHDAGDKYILDNFNKIAGCFRDGDNICRINNTGDELVVVITDTPDDGLAIVADKLLALRQNDPQVKFYFGIASGTRDDQGTFNFTFLKGLADHRQNEDKAQSKMVK